MSKPDTRLHAYRPDLADAGLRGRVSADRFVEGRPAQVSAGLLALHARPDATSMRTTELLFGETVRVFETKDGWAWVRNDSDGYVGYADAAGLREEIYPPTHRIRARRSFVYAEPDLKSPMQGWLSLHSAVAVTETGDGYAGLVTGGYVFADHLLPEGNVEKERDAAQIALGFAGTPYLWGGRSSLGLDCSALMQLALRRCGIDCPRDTDMQEAHFGQTVPYDIGQESMQRGDIVFWPGHVGMWVDRDRFVHANATHMTVTVEPLPVTATRIERVLGQTVSSVRRPA